MRRATRRNVARRLMSVPDIGDLMLRRRLLLNLAPLVGLLLVIAVAVIWLLQRVLSDLHAHDQHELAASFQWIVLGMAGAFLILINTSIILLLRMGRMILRPVDKLVAGTKALAQERFDYRLPVDEGGEFDQLARAFNDLAQRLAANEQRKIEMLGQVSI